jgi:hypothetical protein
MVIKLVDAAFFYDEEQHQINAWNWLQTQVPANILEEFAERYRTKQEAKPEYLNSWDGVLNIAKQAGSKWPECVAAQWALESSWGKHTSGKNNYFGLKGPGSSASTQEFINGQWITIKAGFLDFPDLTTCVHYLVDRWYKDFNKYKGVNRAASRNECARLLVAENYATDPDYATKLIQIMDRQLGTPGTNEGVIKSKLLNVPYEYQLDNKSGTGNRECFSSTCAMIAKYYKKVSTDDSYNLIRSKYGDTTSAEAQIATLRSLGLNARFIMNGNASLLENEIRNNRPVAVGWLHKGPASAPIGSGHWSCCVGFTETEFIFHDPNGEADMVNGGYVNNSANAGVNVSYSRKNWLKRWEINGKNTGWAILVSQ